MNVCVLGDFNVGHITWNQMDNDSGVLPVSLSKEKEIILLDSLFSFGLTQVNHVRNDMNRILDLDFINEYLNAQITDCSPLLRNYIYHKAIEIEIKDINFKNYEVFNNLNKYNFKFNSNNLDLG